MAGRLEGKVIVILGASDERSMGAATAQRCQAEGAKLVWRRAGWIGYRLSPIVWVRGDWLRYY